LRHAARPFHVEPEPLAIPEDPASGAFAVDVDSSKSLLKNERTMIAST
jgi:hypothetical protein